MHKLDFLRQKKFSPADELRELLYSIEERQPAVSTMTSTQALILLRDLDQIYSLFNLVESQGTDLQPERGRFKAIQSRLRNSAGAILKALGGPKVLAEYRPKPAPSRQEQWWWYIHHIVAAQRQRKQRRIIIGLVVIVGLIGAVWLAFNTVFAPSPETIARIEAENSAYSEVDAGNYEAALIVIEKGLAQAPHDPGLLIFKGVVLEQLGQEEKAAQTYEQALANVSNPLVFYFGRGQLNLRINRPEAAERDARAAIEIDEDSANAWLLLGQALEIQGETFEAIPAYENAGQLALDAGENQVYVLARMALGRIGVNP